MISSTIAAPGGGIMYLDTSHFQGCGVGITATNSAEVRAISPVTGAVNVDGAHVDNGARISGIANMTGFFASCSHAQAVVDGVVVPGTTPYANPTTDSRLAP